MKYILVLMFCLVYAAMLGQTRPTPKYYLNGEEFEMDKVYLKPSSIESIRLEKDKEPGEIYLTTKHALTFTTLDEIQANHKEIKESRGHVAFVINDKVIHDKSGIKIDTTFIIQLEIIRFDKVNYIDEANRNFVLVDIHLLNEKPKPVIRIRGEDEAK